MKWHVFPEEAPPNGVPLVINKLVDEPKGFGVHYVYAKFVGGDWYERIDGKYKRLINSDYFGEIRWMLPTEN